MSKLKDASDYVTEIEERTKQCDTDKDSLKTASMDNHLNEIAEALNKYTGRTDQITLFFKKRPVPVPEQYWRIDERELIRRLDVKGFKVASVSYQEDDGSYGSYAYALEKITLVPK